MTGAAAVQRIAERMIRRAGRRLPGGMRDDRYREWAAELPAILQDPDIRLAVLRQARALRYAVGVCRSIRRLSRMAGPGRTAPAGWTSRSQRQPLQRLRPPDGTIPAVATVLIWVGCIAALQAFPPHGSPDYPVLAGGAVADALGIVAIIRFARWLRRRSRRAPRR